MQSTKSSESFHSKCCLSRCTILTIGDPHFKVNNAIEMDRFVEKMLTFLDETLKHETIHAIVLLGDILHDHEDIDLLALTRATKFIFELKKRTKVYLLIGNHDRRNNGIYCTDEHPFLGLMETEGVTVIHKPTIDTISGLNFFFIPYVEPGRFFEALETIPEWKLCRAGFAHQEFYGAKMGHKRSEIGDKYDLEFPLVISGHIHDYDNLQENIVYVGTPIQHSFGDTDDKTISIFMFTNDSIDHKRIDLKLPKKRIITIRSDEELKEYVLTPLDAGLVKVILRGDDAEVKAMMKSHIVKLWKSYNINIAKKTERKHIVKEKKKDETKERKTEKFNITLFRVLKEPELIELFEEINKSTILHSKK